MQTQRLKHTKPYFYLQFYLGAKLGHLHNSSTRTESYKHSSTCNRASNRKLDKTALRWNSILCTFQVLLLKLIQLLVDLSLFQNFPPTSGFQVQKLLNRTYYLSGGVCQPHAQNQPGGPGYPYLLGHHL